MEIARVVGAPEEDVGLVEGWIERGRGGLEGQWDEGLGLSLDRDVLTGSSLGVRTIAGFAPLVAGGLERRATQGNAPIPSNLRPSPDARSCRRPLPPSTSPEEPAFHPRSYWRGPVWPVANWLLWWSLIRAGEATRAAQIRRETLAAARREWVRRVLRAFHRRAPRLQRAVLDGGHRARHARRGEQERLATAVPPSLDWSPLGVDYD